MPKTNLPPVFVGGTGRSGTTVTARILGAHPAYFMIPREVRFVSAKNGLCDLIRGEIPFARFERHLFGEWFEAGPELGLQALMSRSAVKAALRGLKRGIRDDPWSAAARFTHELLDPLALEHGAQGWIEMTPANAREAAALHRLFPGMRLVHCVRDGRDVACSVVPLFWGPDDLDDALDWWATQLERAFEAADHVPSESVHVVQFEDLVLHDRRRSYDDLLAFAGLEDIPETRAYFDERVTATSAHTGRWRHDVPEERVPSFLAHYDALVEAIRERDRPYDPGDDAAVEPAGSQVDMAARGAGIA